MKRLYADSHPPLLNPRDVDFLLYEWLDVAELCDRPRYREHSMESFDSVLDLAADIAIKRFAPHFKTADTKEPFVNPDGSRCSTTITLASGSDKILRSLGRLPLSPEPTSVTTCPTRWPLLVAHDVNRATCRSKSAR
jgi:Acyl-CoA dehydrogenase N terminal